MAARYSAMAGQPCQSASKCCFPLLPFASSGSRGQSLGQSRIDETVRILRIDQLLPTSPAKIFLAFASFEQNTKRRTRGGAVDLAAS